MLSKAPQRIQSKLILKLIIIASLLILSSAFKTKQIEGVIQLSQNTMQRALQRFPILVVYFSSEQCSYCLQFDTTYAIIEQKYRKSLENGNIKLNGSQNPVEFGKILYQENPRLFSQYKVKDAPTIKIFKNGQIMDVAYDCLYYNEDAIQYTLQWIKRAVSPLQQISKKPELANKPIALISCESSAKQEFNKLRIRDIDAQFYCTNNKSLIEEPKKLKIYSSFSFHGEDYTLPTKNIQHNVTKCLFRHKGLLPWDNYAIRNIFTCIFLNNIDKHNAFVLLTNFDDYSQRMKDVVESIRETQDINQMFVVGNLSENLQQVTKIKQYIGVPVTAVYSFPLLVYLSHEDGAIFKYAFNQKIQQYIQSAHDEKSILEIDTQVKYNVEDTLAWMHSAMKKEAKQHIRTASKQKYTIPRISHQVINRLNRADLDELFSPKYDVQAFLYITWRNDYLCSSIEQQIINNWYSQPASQYTNMFTIGLNNNDLTHQLQKYITRLPAIAYIGIDKQITFFDEISSFADIQYFVNEQYKPIEITEAAQSISTGGSQSTYQEQIEQNKQEEKASQVESNLDHLNVMKKNSHNKKTKQIEKKNSQKQPNKEDKEVDKNDQKNKEDKGTKKPTLTVAQPTQLTPQGSGTQNSKTTAETKDQTAQILNTVQSTQLTPGTQNSIKTAETKDQTAEQVKTIERNQIQKEQIIAE